MSSEANFTGMETGVEADFAGTETGTDAAPEQVAETGISGATETGISAEEMTLSTVVEDLYQTGLDLGLTPAEAALLVSEMALPCTYPR